MKVHSILLLVATSAAVLLGFPAYAACQLAKLPDLPVTMRGSRATVPAKVDGADGLFMVDTGAFFSSASSTAVAKYGLKEGPAPFGLTVVGVGHGEAEISVANVKDFVFDSLPFHHIDFIVLDRPLGEDWDGSIGENILGAPDVEYDLANGAIRLFEPTGCRNADLAYWAASQPYSVVDSDSDTALQPPTAFASLNGVRIRVMFDTGSPRSLLSLSAAARAGVKPSDAGVVSSGYTGGVAKRSQLKVWMGHFASFKIGDEEIKNTPLHFGDIDMPNVDMLLGADFFLSHRIFVSNSQHKIYFTYNGGRVFNLDTVPELAPDAAASPSAGSGAPGAVAADAPQDAPAYARRAAAYAARRDYPDAISDLTHAIALAPDDADYVYARGRAEFANKQLLLGQADLDQALKLKPDDISALVTRAMVYRSVRQPAQAKADLESAGRFADKQPAQRIFIAVAYSSMHMFKEALPQLDQWIAENPHDERMAQALNERCWARAQLGTELDKALADCNAALRLDPGAPTMLDSRGLVGLRMGNVDKSIADYNAALRLRPNTTWSLYGRGLAELRKGMATEGHTDIQAAVALDPLITDQAKAVGLTP